MLAERSLRSADGGVGPYVILPMARLGLIAGNGKFPFLVLDAARAQGYDVVVAAIKEETFPEGDARGDGGAGEAQADFFGDQAGLAAGETAACARHAEYRFTVGRGGEGFGG